MVFAFILLSAFVVGAMLGTAYLGWVAVKGLASAEGLWRELGPVPVVLLVGLLLWEGWALGRLLRRVRTHKQKNRGSGRTPE